MHPHQALGEIETHGGESPQPKNKRVPSPAHDRKGNCLLFIMHGNKVLHVSLAAYFHVLLVLTPASPTSLGAPLTSPINSPPLGDMDSTIEVSVMAKGQGRILPR